MAVRRRSALLQRGELVVWFLVASTILDVMLVLALTIHHENGDGHQWLQHLWGWTWLSPSATWIATKHADSNDTADHWRGCGQRYCGSRWRPRPTMTCRCFARRSSTATTTSRSTRPYSLRPVTTSARAWIPADAQLGEDLPPGAADQNASNHPARFPVHLPGRPARGEERLRFPGHQPADPDLRRLRAQHRHNAERVLDDPLP